MKGNFETVSVMLGKAPKKAKRVTEQAQFIHLQKQAQEKSKAEIAKIQQDLEEIRQGNYPKKWRNRRWTVLIILNVVFSISFWADIQLFDGSMIASRVLGFYMADLYSALQIILAYKMVFISLAIGMITVLILWVLLGGRTFCSWVCPYHLLAEWAENIHLKLVANKWVSDHPFHRGIRTIFWIIFALLAFILGYALFNSINPVSIVSRALIYGPSLALLGVLMLLLVEIFYSRRLWCRYVCPMGLTYGAIGALSPMQVTYHLLDCQHEGACRIVCEVPHVLECVKKEQAQDVTVAIGTDCTLCGACIDVCPTHSLQFEIRGLKSFS